MLIILLNVGYLAYFMLKRQLRYSVDSFAAFLRLGAQCWGPRIADPLWEVTLAEEDPGKKERRISLEEEISAKALKKKEVMAAYRIAQRDRWLAALRAQREARGLPAHPAAKRQPKKKAAAKRQPKKKASLQ